MEIDSDCRFLREGDAPGFFLFRTPGNRAAADKDAAYEDTIYEDTAYEDTACYFYAHDDTCL
jgi:hypothetical protein